MGDKFDEALMRTPVDGKFLICCPGHVGARGSHAAGHVVRNVTPADMIPTDRTDILKSVTEELAQEEEIACADNLQVYL